MESSMSPGIWAPLPKQSKQARCRQNLSHLQTRRTFFWAIEPSGPICQECVNARQMRMALAETQENGNGGNVSAAGNAGKRPRTTKAPAIVGAVLAKRANGANKAQIARDLKMSTNTVNKILDESEFDVQIAEGRRACVGLIPKAVTAVNTQLSRGDGTLGLKLLENLQVIGESAANPKNNTHLEEVFQSVQVLIQGDNKPVSTESITVEAQAGGDIA